MRGVAYLRALLAGIECLQAPGFMKESPLALALFGIVAVVLAANCPAAARAEESLASTADVAAAVAAQGRDDAATVETSLVKAEAAPLHQLDRADNAWMLVSSALVLCMTTPGLAIRDEGD